MTRITWGDPGTKFFETGIDQGVLYVDSAGYAWNGLTAVTEKPSGGEAQPFYADGQKYLNLSSSEEFEASIEAFGAPPEFGPCDGTRAIYNGLFVGQQPRKAFGFTYRTLVGNDALGKNYGYKIHLVWNALAKPTERAYSSVNDSPEGVAMSWDLTTLPPSLTGYKPTAYMEIDSRFTPRGLLKAIEDILYGSDAADARLPFQSELVEMFQSEGPLTRTNYAINSSFRKATTNAEMFRNYIKNALFRRTNGRNTLRTNLATNPGCESAVGWNVNNSNYHTVTFDTSVKRSGTRSLKSVPLGSASAILLSLYNVGGSSQPAVAGRVYTGSTYFTSTVPHKAQLSYAFLDSAGTVLGTTVAGPWTSDMPGDINKWNRVSVTSSAAPTNTAFIRYILYVQRTDGLATPSDAAWADNHLTEETDSAYSYFDGSFAAPSPGFLYVWNSTPEASTSSLTGAQLTGIGYGNAVASQSTEWTRPGRTYSARLSSNYWGPGSAYVDLANGTATDPLQLVPGKTYTVSGWFYSPVSAPNTTAMFLGTFGGTSYNPKTVIAPGGGEQYLSMTFTVPSNPTYAYLRLYHGGSAGSPDVWVSDLTLVEGEFDPAFFCGDSSPRDGLTFAWVGEVDNSASSASGLRPDGYGTSTSLKFWRGADGESLRVVRTIGTTGFLEIGATVSTPVSVGDVVSTSIGIASDKPAKATLGYATTGSPSPSETSAPFDTGSDQVRPIVVSQPMPDGVSKLRMIFTPNTTGVIYTLRGYLSEKNSDGGPFFDGSTPDADKYFYYWDGTPDTSTSHVNTWN